MSEYNIQMNKYNALNAEYDQLYPKPMKHANTHAKDGSDPITPASIGAYTKTEADTLLAKKMVSALGQAGANLLEWASAQTVGGAFYINPTVTTADVPIVTWYTGLLEINGAGRRMIISTSGGGSPITYVNVTSAGAWQGWERLATATDLDTKVSKSGDTMTGDLYIKKGSAAIRLNDTASSGGGQGGVASETNILWITNKNIPDNSANYRAIVLRNSANEPSVKSSLQLYDKINNVATAYNILHTGNAQTLGFTKIAIGSYVGTGTYSSANPNTLNFDFEPKVLIVVADGANSSYPGFVIVRGQSYSNGIGSYSNSAVGYDLRTAWAGNSVSWYTNNTFDHGRAYAQLNAEGVTYRYIALG